MSIHHRDDHLPALPPLMHLLPPPALPRPLRGAVRTLPTAILLALCIVSGSVDPARAQTPAAGAAPRAGTGPRLEATTGLTRMAERWSGTVGGTVLLHVHPRVRVGGGASLLLRAVTGGVLSTGEPGELEMAYGGAVGEVDLPLRGVVLRLLAGGGHATLTDPVVGTRADADSFVVLEPSVLLDLSLTSHLSLVTRAGYRWVDGTGGLAGARPGAFSAPVTGFGLRLKP